MAGDDQTEKFDSKLEEILPESIDRRQFLVGTVATMSGMGLAGCSGDGGGDGGGGGGGTGTPTVQDSFAGEGEQPIWRYGWKAEPSYSIGFVGQQRSVWEDTGITAPNVEEGFGSGDAARRVGTGAEAMGMASTFPIITNFAEGGQYRVYGVGKARSQMGLIYNTEVISGPDDLEGTTITRTNSAPQTLSWPFFRDGHGYSEGDMTVQGASEEGAAAQLAQGNIDAVFDTITDYTAIQGQTEIEVGFMPLWNVAQIFGYPLFVNTSFLEDRGVEYMASLMTGYSEAAKWVLLNPEEAVDIMRQDVNTDLQATNRDSQLNGLAAGVFAVNTTDTTRNEGFGFLDTGVLEQTIEVIEAGTDIDVSVDELGTTEIQEQAELATFSDDEWSQVLEFAGEFAEFFD